MKRNATRQTEYELLTFFVENPEVEVTGYNLSQEFYKVIARSTLYNRLAELEKDGVLETKETYQGKRPKRYFRLKRGNDETTTEAKAKLEKRIFEFEFNKSEKEQ